MGMHATSPEYSYSCALAYRNWVSILLWLYETLYGIYIFYIYGNIIHNRHDIRLYTIDPISNNFFYRLFYIRDHSNHHNNIR